jgi:hypothetical protein
MSERIPAISLWQPWASLIARDAKAIETRDWPPPAKYIGRRIAIHATRFAPRLDDLSHEVRAACVKRFGVDFMRTLPRGAVVCVSTLAGAYQCGEPIGRGRVSVAAAVAGSPKRAVIATDPFGDFDPGRWAWLLTDTEALARPAPARGHQTFWSWDGGAP